MTDIVESIIGGLVLVIVGLTGIVIFDGLASSETARAPLGMEVLNAGADAIVMLVVLGLPGALLIIALLRQ